MVKQLEKGEKGKNSPRHCTKSSSQREKSNAVTGGAKPFTFHHSQIFLLYI